MPKTLIKAKPDLQSAIKKALQQASYEAYLTAQENPSDTDPMIKSTLKKELDDAAVKYSKKFAEVASPKLADCIYKFVKEIGIMMTPSGALISTSIMTPSPVIGMAPINDFKVI